MFFCVTDRKRRELSMLTAACVASAARMSASSSVNSPRFLLSTWTTPIVLPEVVLHRRGEDRPRAVAREHVPLGAEARVLVRVLHVERLARPRDVAGDAVADLEPDRAHVVALRDARDELVVRLVEQVERGAVGLERLGDLVENELEQLVEIERRPERDPDLAQRLADAHLAGERRLDRAASSS